MSTFNPKAALVAGILATNLFATAATAAEKKDAKTSETPAKSELALANSTGDIKVASPDDSQTVQQKRDREKLKKSVSRYVADFYVSAY